MGMHMMGMAMPTTNTATSPGNAYVAKPPPLPPPGYVVQKKGPAPAPAPAPAPTTATASSRASSGRRHDYDDHRQARALDGFVLLLRAAAATMAFVAVALVASCRHGDWMEFARYPEYRYLLGASGIAFLYSAAQALRTSRRMRAAAASAGYGNYDGTTTGVGGLLADFAGDQVVAYLLAMASSAALPITLRMRSAVVNIFTDAITAAICLGFIAFAALAFSAMLSAGLFTRRISASAAAQPYYY